MDIQTQESSSSPGLTAPGTSILVLSSQPEMHQTLRELLSLIEVSFVERIQWQLSQPDGDKHADLPWQKRLAKLHTESVSTSQEMFTKIMEASMQGIRYPLVFVDIVHNQQEESCLAIEQLSQQQKSIEIVAFLDDPQWIDPQAIYRLVGLPNFTLLRKPLAQFELAQALIEHARRAQNEANRWEEEGRYVLAMKGSLDGFLDWNLNTSELYFSPRWKEMLGYDEDELSGDLQEWFQRIHPDERNEIRNQVTKHIKGETPFFSGEYRIQHKEGNYLWMLARGRTVRDEEGSNSRFVGVQTDISVYKDLELQQQHDAIHDHVTGLPNRALFMDRLEHALLRTRRNREYRFAVLVLDLDRFKRINDSLGHSAGDELLREIGRRLERLVTPTDTTARLGGDEFAILLDNVEEDMERPARVAERIQQSLAMPFNIEGQEIFTNASIGISTNKRRYERAEELLRDADSAMNTAKNQGKARVEMFVTDMHVQAVTLLQLETDLRRAVDRDELRLFYQPIVALQGGRIIGFEALVRWFKSESCMIPPSSFIPVAEESGLIIPIGAWILEEACRQMQAWKGMFSENVPLTINVNISSQQFAQPDFVDHVEETFQKYGVSGKHIKFELTESVLMDNVESAKTLFSQLNKMGIHLCMDDFGTGYSSLSYLHRFPFHTLKIDRSFVSRMTANEKHAGIVRTILSLAQSLRMNVVAEGVETTKQLAELRSLDCEFGQGYLFSRPLDKDKATELLTNKPG